MVESICRLTTSWAIAIANWLPAFRSDHPIVGVACCLGDSPREHLDYRCGAGEAVEESPEL